MIDVPADHPAALEWIIAEAEAASGFAEVHYDGSGRRREPILRVMPWPEPSAAPSFGPTDVLLVSGGGKGIAAECALALATETGVRLALLGRARPDADPEPLRQPRTDDEGRGVVPLRRGRRHRCGCNTRRPCVRPNRCWDR